VLAGRTATSQQLVPIAKGLCCQADYISTKRTPVPSEAGWNPPANGSPYFIGPGSGTEGRPSRYRAALRLPRLPFRSSENLRGRHPCGGGGHSSGHDDGHRAPAQRAVQQHPQSEQQEEQAGHDV